MSKRDSTRKSIRLVEGGEKAVLLQKYIVLRNKVTAQIQKENIDFNNNRIEAAENKVELWKVTNEVLNPRKENDWRIEKEDGEVVTDEKEVAEAFNHYFIDKIFKLNSNIDQNMVEDPLALLKKKMKNKKDTLEF
jgi:DNA polymerase II small subunit/DNA polymerase delta subunit B